MIYMKRSIIFITVFIIMFSSMARCGIDMNKDMQEHYNKIRLAYANWIQEIAAGVPYPPGGPKREFEFMDAMVLHDIDGFNFRFLCPAEIDGGDCHMAAQEFLSQVIDPLLASGEIRIQGTDGSFESGETLVFDELTPLNITKLLFYYTRDYVDNDKANFQIMFGIDTNKVLKVRL